MIPMNSSIKLKSDAKVYKDSKMRRLSNIKVDAGKPYKSDKHTYAIRIQGREVIHHIPELEGWVHDSDRAEGYSISLYNFQEKGNIEFYEKYSERIEDKLERLDKIDDIKDEVNILKGKLEWELKHEDCLCQDCA